MRVLLAALLLVASTGQQRTTVDVPFVPAQILTAKTISVVVYWPDAGWRDKADVQGDGESFLKHWGRYKVVRTSESPDLIAVVTVEPVKRSGGFWRALAYGLAVGAEAYARSAQNYQRCSGQTDGEQFSATCYGSGYVPPPPSAPPAPQYVLNGSILVFDGNFLRTGAPIPEPLLFANSDGKGSAPLIGAAKQLQKMIDRAASVEGSRMDTVNAFEAKIHELAAASHLPATEQAECIQKISVQIGQDHAKLARLEKRDFSDTETLFKGLCAPRPKQ
jgi:hypothetical protein